MLLLWGGSCCCCKRTERKVYVISFVSCSLFFLLTLSLSLWTTKITNVYSLSLSGWVRYRVRKNETSLSYIHIAYMFFLILYCIVVWISHHLHHHLSQYGHRFFLPLSFFSNSNHFNFNLDVLIFFILRFSFYYIFFFDFLSIMFK